MVRRRRILVVGGAVAAVIVVVGLLLVGAVMMLPAERIGAFAAARAEAMLDRDVEVEGFRIRLLPRPSVSLEGVAIGGPRMKQVAAAEADADARGPHPRPPPAAAFAAVRRIDLRPRLLPLLRRRVVIDEVVLERPQLVVEVAADGTTNLPTLADTGADAGDDAAAGDAELSINRLEVNDGLIGYVDGANKTVVRLKGVDQELKLDGSITSGELSRVALDGVLNIDAVDANMPGLAFPLRDIALNVEHRLDLDRAVDRLDLETLKLTVQEVALDVAGSVQALSDSTARTVTLSASTGSFDVARLIASLPAGLLDDDGDRVIDAAGGQASVDVAVSGRVGAGALPVVDGTLRLDDVALEYGGSGNVVTGLNGQVAFSMDSVVTDGLTGTLLGEPLDVVFNIHDFAKPQGRVNVRTALALDEAERLGLLPEDTRGAGNVALDVTATGPMTEPAAVRLDGTVDLAGVELETPSLEVPLSVEQGQLELRGRELVARGLSARLGQSDMTLDLDAADWLPFALGDSTTTPVVTFDADSRLFDADEVLGPDDSPYTYNQLFFAQLTGTQVDGRSPAQAAEAVGLGMPRLPPIRLDGRVRAAKLIRGGSAFDSVDVALAARNGALEVRAASFRMMGGGVHLSGRLSSAAGGAAQEGVGGVHSLTLDYAVNDVTTDGFLEQFTTFRDRIGGAMLLAGSVRMNLDRYLLPERETVGGAGNIGFVDGRLENWPLTRMLGERLGLGNLDTLTFSDWSGQYRIASSAVVLDEMVLEAGDLQVRAAGSFHLGGDLDLGATVYVPPETASRVPGAPAAFLTNVASDAEGRVPIGARISGTAKSPSIRLDLSEAGALAANRAREAAQAEARELAGRVIGDALGDSVAPTDSLATAADSMKQKVQGDVLNRLKRLVKPPGGGRD